MSYPARAEGLVNMIYIWKMQVNFISHKKQYISTANACCALVQPMIVSKKKKLNGKISTRWSNHYHLPLLYLHHTGDLVKCGSNFCNSWYKMILPIMMKMFGLSLKMFK